MTVPATVQGTIRLVFYKEGIAATSKLASRLTALASCLQYNDLSSELEGFVLSGADLKYITSVQTHFESARQQFSQSSKPFTPTKSLSSSMGDT